MALARSKTTKLVDAPIPGDIGSERTGANSVDPGRSREEIGLPKCTRRRIQKNPFAFMIEAQEAFRQEAPSRNGPSKRQRDGPTQSLLYQVKS